MRVISTSGQRGGKIERIDVLSSSISSISISSPGCLPSKRIESRASLGKLKLVLLLDGVLLGFPEDARPLLENDVRLDGGLESPPVAPALLGEAARPADEAGLCERPFKSSAGMSKSIDGSRLSIWECRMLGCGNEMLLECT